MLRRGVLAGVLLAFAAAGAPAAERVADPTRAFVDGDDPSQNDFFANTPERTVLLRIRDDLDGDGVADLALSESSTWGNAGGQWLLFRGELGSGYAYWGTLFFSPGSAAIGPRPGELTAYVRVGATRGSLRVHRLAAGGITLAGDRSLDLENPADRAAYDTALRAGRRAAVEHCRLLAYRRDPGGCWQPGLGREAALYLPTMTTEEWYEGVTATMLAESPFRRSDYFKRFASGTLTKAQVWGHIAQHYLLIAWFPRIFSGIHTRCEDLEVRKDCARHLLVEDLGYFEGRVGGTPDHDELFRRIGDDLGYARDEYARIVPVPEMAAIVAFFRRLAHDVPWSASLCATALLEEEVVEIARTVGKALVQHYGVRADWGAANYTVHEAIEQEESGETKKTILGHIKTAEDRRAAEAAMREMHDLLVAYAEGLARRYPT